MGPINHKYPCKREAESERTREEKGHVMTEAKGNRVGDREDALPLALKTEEETSQGI